MPVLPARGPDIMMGAFGGLLRARARLVRVMTRLKRRTRSEGSGCRSGMVPVADKKSADRREGDAGAT